MNNKIYSLILGGVNEIEETIRLKGDEINILMNEYLATELLKDIPNSNYEKPKHNENDSRYFIGTLVGLKVFIDNNMFQNKEYGPFAVAEYEINGEKQYKVLIDTKIED